MKPHGVPGLSALAGATVLLVSGAALAAPGSATGDDIRDIRPLIPIPPWWQGLALPLGLAVALAAGLVVYLLFRRHGRRELGPEERAQAALSEAETLARAGRCHEWAELVALTLRNALAARLGDDLCPRTTSELAAVDWSARPHGAVVDAERLLDLLRICDLSRFALGRLDRESLLESTRRARAWVTHLFEPNAVPQPSPAVVEAMP
jgi:hypothetical protein